MNRAVAVAIGLAVPLILAASGAAAPTQNVKLFGVVGPEFVIELDDAAGNPVTRLDPGTYDIEVRDLSDFHTFHLQGPGVDERTDGVFTGTVNWTVTFQDGNYVFFCDIHPELRGALVLGNPPVQPPPSPPPPPPPPAGPKPKPKPTPPAITAKTRLVVTAGPAQVITLRTSGGKRVTRLRRGTYTVVVRDRSAEHNVHLIAPGYNRRTTPIAYRGTQTWKVKLARTGTFQYRCDPHGAFGMRGSAKIVA
jgi:plastocyanin